MDPQLSIPALVELTGSTKLVDRRYATKKIANAAGHAEGRAVVVHHGVPAVTDMAMEPDNNVSVHAARALANMTERGGVNKKYLSQGFRYRSWILAELDAMDAKTRGRVAKGGAPALLSMSRLQSQKMRRHASRDLAFLAKDDPHVKALFHNCGGARTLVSLGKATDPAVCKHAVESLLNLAVSGHIEEDCKYLDILPALEALLDSPDKTVARAAQFALHKVVAMMEAQTYAAMDQPEPVEAPDFRETILAKLAREGVITTLLALAKASDQRIRRHAVRGLANFAQSDNLKHLIVESGGERVLNQCAQSVDVEEKLHASRALGFLHKRSAVQS